MKYKNFTPEDLSDILQPKYYIYMNQETYDEIKDSINFKQNNVIVLNYLENNQAVIIDESYFEKDKNILLSTLKHNM